MKKVIKTVNKIDAPLEKVWSRIRTGESVDTWLPIITSCRVEGNKRYCTTEDGSLNETILRSDDQEKVFQYSIEEQNVFPVTGIVGTMRLEAINEQHQNEEFLPGIPLPYNIHATGKLEEMVHEHELLISAILFRRALGSSESTSPNLIKEAAMVQNSLKFLCFDEKRIKGTAINDTKTASRGTTDV